MLAPQAIGKNPASVKVPWFVRGFGVDGWLDMRGVVALVVVGMLAATGLAGPAEAGAAKALDVLFESGLPDVSKARRVNAGAVVGRSPSGSWALPAATGAAYTGNAWLLRENPDGTAELLGDDLIQIKVRVSKSGVGFDGKQPLQMTIKDADLDKDIATLEKALASPVKADESNMVHFGNRYMNAAQAGQTRAGAALGFVACIQRQGRAEAAEKLIPAVVAMAGSPAAALDFVVSSIAEERLKRLTAEFMGGGDVAAYAAGTAALVAEFPRGWRSVLGAELLAQRLSTSRATTDDPAAVSMAALLMRLRGSEAREVGRLGNWFYEGGADGFPGREFDAMNDFGSDEQTSEELGHEEKEPAKVQSGVMAELKAALSNRTAAAGALALLLDDQRPMPMPHRSGGYPSFDFNNYGGEQPSRADQALSAYASLARPMELGELAWRILASVLPLEMRGGYGETPPLEERKASALRWIKETAGLSGEQVAWRYLRSVQSVNDGYFGPALRYLVAKGGDETVAKLREVFLDPAVWGDENNAHVLAALEPFVARLGGGADAFGAQLMPVVKKAVAASGEDEFSPTPRPSVFSRIGEAMTGGPKVHPAVKRVEQIFKPQNLAELVDDVMKARDADLGGYWDTIRKAAEKAPALEAEKLFLTAAAKTKSKAARLGLISLLEPAWNDEGTPAKVPVPDGPMDAAVLAAFESLLEDTATQPHDDNSWQRDSRTNGERIATAVLMSRLPMSEREAWQAAMAAAPRFSRAWTRDAARRLAKVEKVQAPSSERIPVEKARALWTELSAMDAAALAAALNARSPDEQAAFLKLAGGNDAWPDGVKALHVTVVDATADAAGAKFVDAAKLKGRRFDEAMRKELEAASHTAAVGGAGLNITLSSEGALAGVRISVQSAKRKMEAEQLTQFNMPGVDAANLPDAFAGISSVRGDDGTRTYYGGPVWKDAAKTAEWRKQNMEGEPGTPALMFKVRPVNDAIETIVESKSAGRAAFEITIFSALIGDSDSDEGNEDEDP